MACPSPARIRRTVCRTSSARFCLWLWLFTAIIKGVLSRGFDSLFTRAHGFNFLFTRAHGREQQFLHLQRHIAVFLIVSVKACCCLPVSPNICPPPTSCSFRFTAWLLVGIPIRWAHHLRSQAHSLSLTHSVRFAEPSKTKVMALSGWAIQRAIAARDREQRLLAVILSVENKC